MRQRLLHSTFSGLKLCSLVHSATLTESLKHFTFMKHLKIFRSLHTYAVSRAARKRHHRQAKLRSKLLKRLLLKHSVSKLLRWGFTEWRVSASGMRRVSQVEQMVRHDIGTASQQVTLMRRIIAVTKLEKVCAVRERGEKASAFGKIKGMGRGSKPQRSQSRNRKMDFN